jgi:hypothetical protein
MKKLLYLALLAGATSTAQAQHSPEVGIMLGYARTNLSGNAAYTTVNHAAYQAGLTADLYCSEALSFHPELLYSWRAFDFSDADLSRDISYLDVPLLARYHISGLYLEAGPQLSVPLTAKNEEGDDTKAEVNSVALDYVLGVGYQLANGLSLGVRYDGGGTNVFKNNETATEVGLAKAKSQTFLAVLGYSFGH